VSRQHHYETHVVWTGNLGQGTGTYRAYSRDHQIEFPGKPPLAGSSDPAFRGDPSRYSPEELLVASLSACHMLWYLHLCADSGVVVEGYVDAAAGVMVETADGGGRFKEVVLTPQVVVRAGSDRDLAMRLHERAHALCFIARSVNFDVRCDPAVSVGETDDLDKQRHRAGWRAPEAS
jgi:organic hydroperoxide reductase OsmC/OhrA